MIYSEMFLSLHLLYKVLQCFGVDKYSDPNGMFLWTICRFNIKKITILTWNISTLLRKKIDIQRTRISPKQLVRNLSAFVLLHRFVQYYIFVLTRFTIIFKWLVAFIYLGFHNVLHYNCTFNLCLISINLIISLVEILAQLYLVLPPKVVCVYSKYY